MAERHGKTSVAVAGICGKMGMETAAAIHGHPGLELSLGIERPDHPLCGQVMKVDSADAGTPPAEVRVTDASSAALEGLRVLVDFSSAQAAPGHAGLCASKGVAFVCGVTGMNESGMEALRLASEKVAVLYSPNMSAGINLLARLVGETARRMSQGYDVEIVETHHKAKLDVPSGTAAMLARRAARARGENDNAIQVSRAAGSGRRREGAIAIHSLRGGDVAGEHCVSFIGVGETLTLSHRAHGRMAFARGVPLAIEFVSRAGPGFYTMEDVLG